MTDVVSPDVRSRMMSGIKGRDTKPELYVRRRIHAAGYRFRLHRRDLPGRPDIVMSRHRMAVFVNGCFWHRHRGCRFATTPKANATFWLDKLEGTVARDGRNHEALAAAGWQVVVVWECDLDAGTSKLLHDIGGPNDR